jgi:hypothetical protein
MQYDLDKPQGNKYTYVAKQHYKYGDICAVRA